MDMKQNESKVILPNKTGNKTASLSVSVSNKTQLAVHILETEILVLDWDYQASWSCFPGSEHSMNC